MTVRVAATGRQAASLRDGATTGRPVRILYLMHHPVHYQAPLLRRLAAVPAIAIKTAYVTDLTARGLPDGHGFGAPVAWDTTILDGYDHQLVAGIGSSARISPWSPVGYGVFDLVRKADVLWVHGYAQITMALAIAAALRRNIPVLFRGESSPPGTRRSLPARLLKRAWLGWLLPRVAGVLYIGGANREYYRQFGVPDHKLFPVPYAVDNDAFQRMVAAARPRRAELRQRLGLNAGAPIILYAGKLLPRKRPLDLLDAYCELHRGETEPNACLLYAGDGELRPAIEQRARERGWRSIRVLGFQRQDELAALYDLCDVFVLPSTDEPWGMVVNEVMNAGRPVIATDQVGSAVDLVDDGVNGWRYPAGDTAALTSCLRQALADPARLARMGEASLARINEWSFEQDVAGLLAAVRALPQRPIGGGIAAERAVEAPAGPVLAP